MYVGLLGWFIFSIPRNQADKRKLISPDRCLHFLLIYSFPDVCLPASFSSSTRARFGQRGYFIFSTLILVCVGISKTRRVASVGTFTHGRGDVGWRMCNINVCILFTLALGLSSGRVCARAVIASVASGTVRSFGITDA